MTAPALSPEKKLADARARLAAAKERKRDGDVSVLPLLEILPGHIAQLEKAVTR